MWQLLNSIRLAPFSGFMFRRLMKRTLSARILSPWQYATCACVMADMRRSRLSDGFSGYTRSTLQKLPIVRFLTSSPSPQKSNMVKLPMAPCVCPLFEASTTLRASSQSPVICRFWHLTMSPKGSLPSFPTRIPLSSGLSIQ